MSESRIRVLLWHIHGSYLYYLTKTPCEFYLPVKPGSKEEGYGGKTPSFPWGNNVHNVPADKVKELTFDVILFQSRKNYLEDQFEILTEEQRKLPKIYLEHDPPREVPTDTKHIVDDPDMLLVHVTDFNNIMWNNNHTPSKVIQHGVELMQNAEYTGELEKGIVVINGLGKRGRRLGLDIFEKVRKKIPLDLVGMGSKELGGIGEVPNAELPEFISKYRFFFNPIRYTSLGLSVCEAMMVGMPVVGLATTEMVVAIENGHSGFIDTNVDRLIERMEEMLLDPEKARQIGYNSRMAALLKFNITRFAADWLKTFRFVIEKAAHRKMKEV